MASTSTRRGATPGPDGACASYRLEEKLEAERGALFESSRRIALPRYPSEEVDLESSAGLPEFTMPESARKTAQVDPRDETASQFATERAPGATSFDDESLSTFDGNNTIDGETQRHPRKEEETVREGSTRSNPDARGLPPPSSNLRIVASTSSMDQALRSDPPEADPEIDIEAMPVRMPLPAPSRSRLVSGLSLSTENSTMSSGPVELRPEDLLELSGSAPPLDFRDPSATGRAPPPAPLSSLDEPWDASEPPEVSERSTADVRVQALSELRSTREQDVLRRSSWRAESALRLEERSASAKRWWAAGIFLIIASVVTGAALEVYVLSNRRASAAHTEESPAPLPADPPRARLEAASASIAAAERPNPGATTEEVSGAATASAAAEAPPKPAAIIDGPRAFVDPEIEVHLVGLPAGARVDGSGPGPGGIVRAVPGATLHLTAPGYRPFEVRVAADGPRTIQVHMKRRAR